MGDDRGQADQAVRVFKVRAGDHPEHEPTMVVWVVTMGEARHTVEGFRTMGYKTITTSPIYYKAERLASLFNRMGIM